ncbi:DUF4198 domain-containing protein [Novosphingobium capsulatum]|uniref:DUF4198 domain-containing protein n=1 Tax=Novosphingobium capsulatum TaxID=13688 RepID=UPI000786AD93|nr:DUF4198 domain-containing protein [Novosphingobium capsulatum]WQD93576.1 DUF4198 domain-containing protein [Novosphingobium capsulatum]
MNRKTLALAAPLMALALGAPARAHRMWLLPSITVLADTNQSVTVDAAISNDLFYPDHFPLGVDQVKVWAPDGTPGKIENAARLRTRSVFDVAIDKPGTWKIGTEMANLSGTFKVNGELWGLGMRRPGGPGGTGGTGGPGGQAGMGAPPRGMMPGGPAGPGGPGGPGGGEGGPRPQIAPDHMVASLADIPADATEVNLTETLNRNFVFVTAGTPTTQAFAPSGKGLEMVPITHPDELVSDEPGKFRFLIDGQPAAKLKVTVIPGAKRYRDIEGAQELTTAADGTVTVKWPVPGFYWLNASLTDDHPANPRAAHRRTSYTTTLEVVAP